VRNWARKALERRLAERGIERPPTRPPIVDLRAKSIQIFALILSGSARVLRKPGGVLALRAERGTQSGHFPPPPQINPLAGWLACPRAARKLIDCSLPTCERSRRLIGAARPVHLSSACSVRAQAHRPAASWLRRAARELAAFHSRTIAHERATRAADLVGRPNWPPSWLSVGLPLI